MTTPEIPEPPSKPLTLSGFLFGSIMTGALVCGGIGALAVLFLADGVIDIGPDPAIPSAEAQAEVRQELAKANARLQELEKIAQAQKAQKENPAPAAPENLQELQQTVDANAERTEQLQEKVETLSNGKQEEGKAAQIALGLTQLKTAYENDLPMAAGIDTLKNAIPTESLQKSLDELKDVTTQNFPTKKELLADIAAMKASLAPTPVDPGKLTWEQRAKYEMGKFVQIQPKQVAAQRSLLNQTEDYIRNNDFTAALEAAKQFPENAQQQIFYKKISLRLSAQNAIHKVITDVTQKIGVNGGGKLY